MPRPNRARIAWSAAFLCLGGCAAGDVLCAFPRWNGEKVALGEVDPAATVDLSSRLAGPLPLTPENTRISFVGSSKTASHSGEFKRFAGTLELPDGDPLRAKFEVEVDVASLTSPTVMLAWYLKSKSAFDAAAFPTASFRSSRVEARVKDEFTHFVTGGFSIHGRTRSVGFPARFSITEESVDFTAEITLKQTDFGLDRLAAKTENDVPVTVVARLPWKNGLLARKPAEAPLRTASARAQ